MHLITQNLEVKIYAV